MFEQPRPTARRLRLVGSPEDLPADGLRRQAAAAERASIRPPVTPTEPVLAVLDGRDAYVGVLQRAAAAARALDRQLLVAVLEPRLGFTTDAALVGRAHRRARLRRAQVQQFAHDHLDVPHGVEVRALRCSSRPEPRRRWHAVAALVRRTGACLVVGPVQLADPTVHDVDAEVVLVG